MSTQTLRPDRPAPAGRPGPAKKRPAALVAKQRRAALRTAAFMSPWLRARDPSPTALAWAPEPPDAAGDPPEKSTMSPRVNGPPDTIEAMEIVKSLKFESPRGPIAIDPDTRDIVQNVYIRRTELKGGKLQNTEIFTYPMFKDPSEHQPPRPSRGPRSGGTRC